MKKVDRSAGASPVTVINLGEAEAGPAYPKISKDNRGWLKWGCDNLYPQRLLEAGSRSPVNGAILESKVTYICGKGVRDSAAGAKSYVGTPHTGGTWDEVLERVATDYVTFGGFALQVIVNKGGSTVSVFHQDFSEVRLGQIDDFGNALTYRISNDWSKAGGSNRPLELKAWPGSIEGASRGEAYLYYAMEYRPGLRYYPVPSYYNAMPYVEADGDLAVFYRGSIRNGFLPSVVISMPSNPPEEERERFQRAMEAKFCGPTNTSRVLIVWGEDGAVKPEIEPFTGSANADSYNDIEGIVFQKIISAHRLASPTLAGVSGSGNLSGNASEIVDAFILYNYTVIEQMRRRILDRLNVFTRINGVAPLTVEELEVVTKIRESENAEQTIMTPQDSRGGGGSDQPESESLASRLGVGGTQALTAILENPGLTESRKRGILSVLFGIGDEEIERLFSK
ncbi:hypothetical protein [uncultured Alistipes sp.]|uniref:hypothetical protein n=1 Tax=uncultured Alistipes sp. TaxID=538949 RepID=UPI0026650E47|nr:hypothetical protein [uncultured Alistipes sp.]